MLTKTSLTAIRTLVYLGLHNTSEPVSLKRVAEQLGESPTYLAKVARLLVRVGILRAHRGVTGGVLLNRPAETITLLSIVEACQGIVVGDFCQTTANLRQACAFHQAGVELHHAILGVLSRWTLADFLRRPEPSDGLAGHAPCWLQGTSAHPPGAPVASRTQRRRLATSRSNHSARPRRRGGP